MSEVLIIGYGNTLRGDDGLGYIAAERLREAFQGDAVRVVARHQLGPELAAEASAAGFVVFIDARHGDHPGEIDIRYVHPAGEVPLTFSHHISPESLLSIARSLFGRAPDARLVTITGESFAFGRGLSTTLTRRVQDLIRCVTDIVAERTRHLSER